jgi:DNA-directed RNA polymerase delta subunit
VVAIGKTSTYALASWSQVKTGTIKQLAKEFLENHEHPVHLSDLSKHVNKFRKTHEKNVYSNLKLDRTGTFVFLQRGVTSV